MSVKQAILDFTDGEIRNRIFVTPDTAALRAELASWLSSAEQDASIDNDGDLTVSLNAAAPAFAKDFRGWVAQYDLKINSEGVTEEVSDSTFYGRDEGFFIRSPYCRVGKLASASYEMAIKLQVYTLQELEIHEVVLKDGALSIPKLGSSQVKIKSLSARRDDDGSSFRRFGASEACGEDRDEPHRFKATSALFPRL